MKIEDDEMLYGEIVALKAEMLDEEIVIGEIVALKAEMLDEEMLYGEIEALEAEMLDGEMLEAKKLCKEIPAYPDPTVRVAFDRDKT